MTRRERAAMALALEVLRGVTVRRWDEATLSDVFDILVRSGRTWLTSAPQLRELTRALPWWAIEDEPQAASAASVILARARLALYLRARLRAERGDMGGRWVCVDCKGTNLRSPFERFPQYFGGPMLAACRDCDSNSADYTCRITPFWQQAPAHGHWRHRCAGGRSVDLPRGEECAVCGTLEPRRGGA